MHAKIRANLRTILATAVSRVNSGASGAVTAVPVPTGWHCHANTVVCGVVQDVIDYGCRRRSTVQRSNLCVERQRLVGQVTNLLNGST